MQRRQVLAALGALATAGLAGCGGSGGESGPAGPPTGPGKSNGGGGSVNLSDAGPITAYPSLEARDFRVYNDSGKVTVRVLVANPAERRRTMVLNVSTRIDGELAKSRRELSMEAGANRSVNMTLPVQYDQWGGGLDFDFEIVE